MWDEASTYGDVVYEYDGSGSTLASYVLGGTGLISQTRSGNTDYYLQDGQGSTRALTNSTTGAITDTYSYTAFGELFSSTGTTTNSYRYTGQQFDSATGLYDLRARYYNPALGRFLSQDTYPYDFSKPIELNRYVYTANSPINLTDPSGKAATVEYAIVLGVGATYGIALTHFCGGDLAINGIFGALGAALFWAVVPPPIFVLIALAGALSAIQEIEVKGPNQCSGFKAISSLLMVAIGARGMVTGGYTNNSGVPNEVDYSDQLNTELNNPNGMGHDGYSSGTGPYSDLEWSQRIEISQ